MMRTKGLLVAAALAGAAGVVWLRGRGDGAAAEAVAVPAEPTARAPAMQGGASAGEPELHVDDDPAGALRLEGQVIDAGERPIAGARVTVSSAPPRTVESEADGSFHFEGLLPRAYTLVAVAEGATGGPVTARLSGRSEPVILRVEAAFAVEVEVVAAGERRPIAGARVALRGLAGFDAETDGAGVAAFAAVPAGSYQLVASAEGRAPARMTLLVPKGRPLARQVVELRGGAPVAGRVVGEDGAPVAGATVAWESAAELAPGAAETTESDRDGRFQFAALPAGTFRFTARDGEHAPGTSALVTLDGASARDGVEITLPAGAAIAGVVRSAEGAPVAGALVRVAARDAGPLASPEVRQATSDGEGRFRIAGLPRRAVDVVAVAEEGASEITTVELTTDAELTLTLALAGVIAGLVVDPAGEPIAGAQVWAVPNLALRGGRAQDFALRGPLREVTDAGGRFELRGLPDSSFLVNAGPSDADGAARRRLGAGVRADTGDLDVKLVLPVDGAIAGRLAFADGRAPEVFAVDLGGGVTAPFAGDEGRFQLDGIPPGVYTVTVRGFGFESRQVAPVVVQSARTTDLGAIRVREGRTMVGRVVTPEGRPVPGALVVAGRRLHGTGATTTPAAGAEAARGLRQVVTDERGEFTVPGLGASDLSVVAEHERLGRSTAVRVVAGGAPPRLELVLLPFASLEGTVRLSGGAPAVEVLVNLNSQTVPGTMFAVATGADGRYVFDRLAADTYVISAVTGGPQAGKSLLRAVGMHSQVVTIAPGEAATLDLTVSSGAVSLFVTPVTRDGRKARFAQIIVAAGTLRPGTARELEYQLAGLGPVYSSLALYLGESPSRFEDIEPGAYSVCAIPVPDEVQGRTAILAYLEREGDALPAFCQAMRLEPTPDRRWLSLPVDIPAYVPPPEEPAGEGGS
jgi:hypothetical protein